MAGEWKTVTIKDVSINITKGTTPTTLGGHFVDQGISFIKVESINDDGRIESNKLAYIDESTNMLLSRSILQKDDILFTIAGTIGRVALIPKNILPANVNQAVAIVRPNQKVVLPRFLFYALRDDSRVRQAQTRVVQSVQANFSLGELSSLEIPLPPFPEQRAIAHILGTLEDKIELNRRMNKTLEEMARALFKSWFVDFDPVRAKASVRREHPDWTNAQVSRAACPNLKPEIAELFPDRLVDSELGEIPEGWEVTYLRDILGEIVSGGRPKGGAAEEGVPSVGAENVIGLGKYDFSKEKYIPRDFFKELQRKGAAVRSGDVLLYKDGAQIGRKTYFDCGFPHAECAVNEHVFILRAKHPSYQRYLFFWLDQDSMTQEIISLNSNSAQPGINQQAVLRLPFLIPLDPVVYAFNDISKALTDRLLASCLENRTLAALRDALLPKLISGEIRVKDAERFLKEREL